MNYRFAAVLLPVLALASTVVKTTAQAPSQTPAPRFPSRTELIREIDVNENALQAAQSAHAAKPDLAKIYDNLGALYVDAALYLKSEDAMQHAIALLENGPPDRLAEEISRLAMLHNMMGDSGKAEKEQLRAIQIRETLPDPIALTLARSALAGVYIKQHKYNKALGPAQQAVEVLSAAPARDPAQLIAAQQRLALALCGLHQCDRAVQVFREAADLASRSYGSDSLTAGITNYLLGYFYWKDGNMDAAADAMQRGTSRMRIDMGWGHAIYLNAMAEYAKFLRERGDLEAASAAQREVRKATSTVDIRTLTARSEE
jgi:tetratricopeptide (TPR) repeat protein